MSASAVSFDSHHPRVRQAKLRRAYNNRLRVGLIVVALIALLTGGTVLLILGNRWAWTLFGLAALPAMLIYWIEHALANVPVGPGNSFTDLVSEDLLLLLTETTTPANLIELLPRTGSGTFLMARFGLTTPVLQQVASFFPTACEPIFERALTLRETTNSEEITGAILVVALISSVPNYESLLAQLQLEPDDLNQGIIWFNYLNGLVKDMKRPTHSGGIARDFAFGYTPTLQRYAVNLSERYTGSHTRLQQGAHTAIVEQMIDSLAKRGHQNVALVGAYGTGRTTLVNVLAETLMNADSAVPRSLKFRQIFSLDAPSLIASASNPAELAHLIINIFNEIYSAKNIILCLDNAHLFFEDGSGSVDIANLLLPVLESGQLRLILIMDEQKFLEISARYPALAATLNKITVKPADRADTIKVLMDRVPFLEYQKNVVYTYRALTEAYRLSNDYIHDIAMPGKAKQLLESAAAYASHGLVTAESVATAVEQAYGVQVKVATGAAERDRLLHLEELIHTRMVDQVEAVSAVANALRRAAAGVKNTGRPIGTFLFLGPTGVGKTELARTLADVYFGGTGNLIRLDLNEFVTADDVSRLIEDATVEPTSLTASVMKHPFSVVLLDEIEKAHPAVLTTLLQMLDEGILRDARNREVSFRDSIIIATSNAGADLIREQIAAGAALSDFKDSLIDGLIERGEMKPEFLNRFDEICLFKPLSKDDLLQVLNLIIASVNHTLEPQKISVTLDPAAAQLLIEQGYDPKMGARPMRRVVQKTVENIVAAAILSGHATPGSTLHITPHEININ